MKKKKEPEFRWGQYLKERRAMIVYWVEVEGLSFDQVVEKLATDPLQIRLVYESASRP